MYKSRLIFLFSLVIFLAIGGVSLFYASTADAAGLFTSRIGQASLVTSPLDMEVVGSYAYITEGNYRRNAGYLQIFDLSNPAMPTQA